MLYKVAQEKKFVPQKLFSIGKILFEQTLTDSLTYLLTDLLTD